MSSQPIEEMGESLPQRFSVSLIMQQSPAENPWVDSYWEAVGILAGERVGESKTSDRELILEQDGVRRYLYRGFTLRLHEDECESYYHNLLAPSPCCYVVVSQAEDDMPRPLLLSLSFDEAHAYLEGDENLYTVPIPPEIYQWTEAYVLNHYTPEKRTKRKRKDWRKGDEAEA
jgi:hypothetical protein